MSNKNVHKVTALRGLTLSAITLCTAIKKDQKKPRCGIEGAEVRKSFSKKKYLDLLERLWYMFLRTYEGAYAMDIKAYLKSKIQDTESNRVQLDVEEVQQILSWLEHLNTENAELVNKCTALEAKYKKCREMRFVQGSYFLELLEDAEKLRNGQREDIFVYQHDEWVWRGMLDKSINFKLN